MRACFIFASLFIFANSALADFYKCILPDGTQNFQDTPCKGVDSEILEIAPTSSVSKQSQPEDAQNYLNRERNREVLRGQLQQNRQDSNQRWEEYEKDRCQRYKDYLTRAEERWETAKRGGYKQWQKEYYEQQIIDAERDVKIKCN